jgi:hypothetical protein
LNVLNETLNDLLTSPEDFVFNDSFTILPILNFSKSFHYPENFPNL